MSGMFGRISHTQSQALLPADIAISELDFRCVRAQVFQRNEFESADMSRREYDVRRASSFKRFLPSSHAQAPAITAFETGKAELWNWRAEIVAGFGAELKEILGHHRAHGVQPVIARTGAAVAIAIEAGPRLATAAFELAAKDIRGVSHAPILYLDSF
jgi:hypothetical protein